MAEAIFIVVSEVVRRIWPPPVVPLHAGDQPNSLVAPKQARVRVIRGDITDEAKSENRIVPQRRINALLWMAKQIFPKRRPTPAVPLRAGDTPSSLVTPKHVTVRVIRGDITDQMIDCICICIRDNLSLQDGMVSKAVLQRAGKEIQTELIAVAPRKPKHGSVYVTDAYKLKASYVFHGTLVGFKHKDAEKILRKFVRACLRKASKRGLRTIAFPVIGSRDLAFPVRTIATCTLEETIRFSKENPKSTVGEVRIVIRDQDEEKFKVFQSAIQEMLYDNGGEYLPEDEWEEPGAVGGVPPSRGHVVRGHNEIWGTGSDDDDERAPAKVVLKLIDAMKMVSAATVPHGLYPANWSNPHPVDPYQRIRLSAYDQEYVAILNNVKASVGQERLDVVKIERIEHYKNWHKYMASRSCMSNGHGNMRNERLLWHGTSLEALSNIYVGNFNRSYAGKNATSYGQGVYFARDFSYSAHETYSPVDRGGYKYIFQCRVLTGYFTTGKAGMLEPPVRSGKLKYDSVVNDVTDPKLWVIFRDAHAYPDYLVTVKYR